MNIQRREVAGVVVLDVAGEYFGGPETQALERSIMTEIARGHVLLVIDLSNCKAMNSTALGILIEAHRACATKGGVIKLCGAQRRVKNLLDVLHVESLFHHQYTSEAEALASFVERAWA